MQMLMSILVYKGFLIPRMTFLQTPNSHMKVSPKKQKTWDVGDLGFKSLLC